MWTPAYKYTQKALMFNSREMLSYTLHHKQETNQVAIITIITVPEDVQPLSLLTNGDNYRYC